ncbi:hypothetical protein IKN40_05025, partial [bacterium]|nr:hypothetical protein [bacterium]
NALSDEYKNKIDANLMAELILALGKFSKITKEDMIDAFDFYFPADAFGGQEEQNKLALEIIKRHKKSILEFATEFLNEINK